MAKTNGYCDPTFSSVREALEQQLKQETELGASICVNIDGKNVIDLWGGYTDVARSRPWKEYTVTVAWSCSKVVTSLAVVILIDRGLLDPNEKVSTYWPEFGINGKVNIKVSWIWTTA
ncbi:hypothetical protein NUU61_006864 [Penicillium alfredii]|uniref:Beta-lactamase-related domain-containing protein n=1 Tax=Penicillium alfredii TaxID=1506179 RepID=A0A9W9K3R7_9EURO|nr:uncharacterized protein NUU61_006864 [Penicillium alfredii]KAJ5091994.1 hypothetical protein NUU61_006864 [Penicillium alfredii]